MPTLNTSDFNIVCSVLGGFVLLFGLVSYFVKERLYLSEALIALLVGIALGPQAANFIRPLNYALGDNDKLESITLAFTRLVLGVQLVLAGVQLPKKYLLKEWKSLAMLLGPVMTVKWFVTSLLIWGLIPKTNFLHALVAAACITPTDPILANSIVKGKFADAHIPVSLQRIIIAESGANDGLGYPFVFIALYLVKYSEVGQPAYDGGVAKAVGLWFGETMGYTIILSVIYGFVVGWLAKELLHWAESKKLVDRESFLVFAIALALFIAGTCGMIGSDDVLASFIAGNAFTLDDWFRLETQDDNLQPTIDMLLNETIFLWFGAVIPWSVLAYSPDIPIGRVVALGILILLLRRPPIVMLLHRWIPRIKTPRESLFAGYFGPIGVSAVFYLYVCLEFLDDMKNLEGVDKNNAEDCIRILRPVVWIGVVASVVVHGITVPMIKLGNAIPLSISASRISSRSFSRRNSTNISREPNPSRTIPGLGTRIRAAEDERRARPGNIPRSDGEETDEGELKGKHTSSGENTDDEGMRVGKESPRAAKHLATEPGLPTSSPRDVTFVEEDRATPRNAEEAQESIGEAPRWQRERKIKIVDNRQRPQTGEGVPGSGSS